MTLLADVNLLAQTTRDNWIDDQPEVAVPALSSLDRFIETAKNRTSIGYELDLVSGIDDELNGFGILQPFLTDARIEEIWINKPGEIRYARDGISHRVHVGLSSEAIENLGFKLLRNSSRRVDRMHPFVDATLPDGSRVHIVIPPVTASHWAINIRKFPARTRSLEDLVNLGMLSESQADFLTGAVRGGANLLVSGSTNAGKTTFLSAVLGQLERNRRVVSVEESHELRLNVDDWVAMQGRQEPVGDAPAIDLRRLVRESLRMRPDYLVVGEVRGAEALELLLAMNTGIPAAGTIHAKSASAALSKFMLLPTLAQANLDLGFIRQSALEVVDVVVHLETQDGRRRVREIKVVNDPSE